MDSPCSGHRVHRTPVGTVARRLNPSLDHPTRSPINARFVIRRQLVCDGCFRLFVYSERAICAFATIAGKVWCLRQRPDKRTVIYTRERWVLFVDRMRHRCLSTEGSTHCAK